MTTLETPRPVPAVVDRGHALEVASVVARVQRVQQIMESLMKEGTHYGQIPGTAKKTLLKPGAELLCLTFQISPKPNVEDLSGPDEYRYRVLVEGLNQTTGAFLGGGVGEGSTSEEKYRWRTTVHENEWNATPDDRRRLKFSRDGKSVKQVRTSPADLAHTVLLMATKRALVAMTRMVCACSDIFDQDLEDLSEELRQQQQDGGSTKRERKQPQRRSEKPATQATQSAKPDGEPVVARGRVQTCERVVRQQGDFFRVKLVDDARLFTTFDVTVGLEIETFAGTDHAVEFSCVQKQTGERTFFNFDKFKVVEQGPATLSSQPDLSSGDVEWGS